MTPKAMESGDHPERKQIENVAFGRPTEHQYFKGGQKGGALQKGVG